jgi:hypothetical protein
MKDYIRRMASTDALILLGEIVHVGCVVSPLALLLSWACPGARAEEPAYWPPCGEPGQDSRCPPPPRTPLPGHTSPEVQCSP